VELQLASLEGPVERVTTILTECVLLFEICIAGGVEGLQEWFASAEQLLSCAS
jgi:hypothetical protein